MPNPKPQVVRMLKSLLETAERGEISSFAAASFKPNGGTDFSGEFTETPDIKRAGAAIEELKQQVTKLAGGT